MRRPNLPVLAATGLVLAACADHSHVGPPAGGVLRTVHFETRTELAAARGAADVAIADFDGNGALDVAIACLDSTVVLQANTGNGTFAETRRIVLDFTSPAALAAADLDGDLDQDLLVLDARTGNVIVLLNSNGGSFNPHGMLTVGPAAFDLSVGDCNRDGVPDVVVTEFGLPRVSVYHGAGNATFGAPVQLNLPAGSEAAGVTIADPNRDGINDIVVADKRLHGAVLIPGLGNGGHGNAQGMPGGFAAVAVAVGDVNRDGRPDVVQACLETQSLMILLNESGPFGEGWRLAPRAVDGTPGSVFVADVTGDGINDIVTCMLGRCAVSVLEGLEDGTLGEEVQLGAGGMPAHAASADLNGDGRPDLVAAGGGDHVSLWFGRSGGLAGSINYRTDIDSPEFVAAGDFDGDGQNEVAVGGRGSGVISLMRREPAPVPGRNQLRTVAQFNVGRPVYNLSAADLDRDGRSDLVVSCQGGVKLLVHDGQQHRVLPAAGDSYVLPAGAPFEVGVGDLDGDGRADLVAADVDGAVQIAHALEAFRFGAPVRLTVPGKPAGVAIGDFVLGGRPDVAISRNAANLITILRNDGGTYALHSEVPVGVGPNYLRTADFDGDGRADLVVSNAGADAITVLLAGGAGGFRALELPAGERPTALLARDLNRDGWPDILVASLVGADFRVLLGDGRGGFPGVLPFPGTYRATSAAMADLDGDALLDLLVASVDTNRLSLYRNLSR